jgi:NADH:ubiquinone oxidoreductase subunit F (NADH-binding)/(2Fe-2S) ferredoxin
MSVTKEKRIATPQDLHELAESLQESQGTSSIINVCGGTGCSASGSGEVYEALQEQVQECGLEDRVRVGYTGCHGLCELGPLVVMRPEDILYCNVEPDDAADIMEKTAAEGEVVERLLYEGEEGPLTHQNDVPFYNRQMRVVLRLNGIIDPRSIDEYIREDGYRALQQALEMDPAKVIQMVKDSGLRGRGGAGFPTGIKWGFCSNESAEKKYIICNADEGDPGAFMDRSVVEGNPHSVVEGAAIAAYAIGADEGYFYIRAEYPLAVRHLGKAINDAEEAGLLGEDIMGSGFDLDLHINEGAGAFVCGEETALLSSIEGRRGHPRPRPPFPAQEGLHGKPTNINNVETLANVPAILRNGPDWFTSMGTEDSPGTKVFSLVGNVRNTGLIEVPMGITLREVIYDIGGGIPGGADFKAVQTGGPSGGTIPAEKLDLPVDYENLTKAGSMMGSGGMVVMDENTCMVDVARYFLDFTCDESCGKCTPCRLGTRQMLDILGDICSGEASDGQLDLLEEIAHSVAESSLCGLGQTAPKPVLTTLRYFRDEYEEHLEQKRCRAGVCRALTRFEIDHETCIECMKCVEACPVDAIPAEDDAPGNIEQETCTRCRSCYETCPVDAIYVA